MTADHSKQPIFPQYKSPIEWPWPITLMVLEARRIISYYELPEDWQPPQSLWHSPKKSKDYIDRAMDKKTSGDGAIEFDPDEIEK